MYLVESIILPHLEVLDKNREKGGDVIFADIWNMPFSESLKIKIKGKGWLEVVICEFDTRSTCTS